MNVRHTWLVPVVVLGLLGCSGPEVRYDFDARADFAGYRNYGWRAAPGGIPGRAGEFDNAIMNARVKRVVQAEFAAKGFTEGAGAAPDFLVTYYPITTGSWSHQPRVGMGLGLGPVGMGFAAPVGPRRRDLTGSIVLEVQDFKSGSVVWKATADGALQTTDSPEEADAAVTAAVRNMLKKFPPKAN
jgi:hypothetical protein